MPAESRIAMVRFDAENGTAISPTYFSTPLFTIGRAITVDGRAATRAITAYYGRRQRKLMLRLMVVISH